MAQAIVTGHGGRKNIPAQAGPIAPGGMRNPPRRARTVPAVRSLVRKATRLRPRESATAGVRPAVA